MDPFSKNGKNAIFIGARSAFTHLLLVVLCVSLQGDTQNVSSFIRKIYEQLLDYLHRYPQLREDLQHILGREDLIGGLSQVVNSLLIFSSIFLLSNMLMICGVTLNNKYGKWLILPWLMINIFTNIIIFSVPVFLVAVVGFSFLSWRFVITICLAMTFFINMFIVHWSTIEVVLMEFNNKKSGLKSWKTISPDLTSDRVCLVSALYEENAES